jgi:hypothetical protein
MVLRAVLWAATLVASAVALDPRHEVDPRCAPAVEFDNATTTRMCRSCGYLTTALAAGASALDCARLCCGDWSCLSFVFVPPIVGPTPSLANLSGSYDNNDSLRGQSGVTLTEFPGGGLLAVSSDPAKAFWSQARGVRFNSTALFLCFDCSPGSDQNNRTGSIALDAQGSVVIALQRLDFDPPGVCMCACVCVCMCVCVCVCVCGVHPLCLLSFFFLLSCFCQVHTVKL